MTIAEYDRTGRAQPKVSSESLCDNAPSPAVCYTDHDPQVRAAITRLCQSHGWKFHALSADEFSQLGCEVCDPGSVVIDLDDPSIESDQVVDMFFESQIFVPVVVVAEEANISKAVQAMRAGAIAFLGKPIAPTALDEAIVTAMRAEEHQRELRGTYRQAVNQLAKLTQPQRRVLGLLMEGASNKTIAGELDIGLRTVERDRAQILNTLDCGSLAELARKVVIAELQPVGMKKLPFVV